MEKRPNPKSRSQGISTTFKVHRRSDPGEASRPASSYRSPVCANRSCGGTSRIRSPRTCWSLDGIESERQMRLVRSHLGGLEPSQLFPSGLRALHRVTARRVPHENRRKWTKWKSKCPEVWTRSSKIPESRISRRSLRGRGETVLAKRPRGKVSSDSSERYFLPSNTDKGTVRWRMRKSSS